MTSFSRAAFKLPMLLAASLLFLAGATRAAPVVKRAIHDDPRDSIVARVLASFTAHARPAQSWYVDLLGGRHPNTREFSGFSTQLQSATFVSFTYEFTVNGQRHRRVYHARSGRNDLVTGLPDARNPRPYQSYFPHHGSDTIAWAATPPRGSAVTSSPVQGDRYQDARKRDAELKVARAIERDIRDGRVVAGGNLYGYSSQEPCPSCEGALQALSDQHGIPVHVAYLDRGSPAYRRFDRQRHQHLTSIEVAVNGGQLNLLNQVAERPSEQLAVDCIDGPGDGEVDEP